MKAKKIMGFNKSTSVVFKKILTSLNSSCWQLKGGFPCALSYVTNVAGVSAGNTAGLLPFDLLPSERQFLPFVNLYKQFRIKWVKFKWIPAVPGIPRKVITQNVAADAVTWDSPNPIVWDVRHPRYADHPDRTKWMHLYDGSEDYSGGTDMSTADLFEDNTLKKYKHPLFKSFSIAFKAKVRRPKVIMWNEISTLANPSTQQINFEQYWKQMGWCDIVRPNLGEEVAQINDPEGSIGEKITANLRQPLWEPFIAVQSKAGAPLGVTGWYDSDDLANAPQIGDLRVDGEWQITSKWEFRIRRTANRSQWYRLSESGTEADATVANNYA